MCDAVVCPSVSLFYLRYWLISMNSAACMWACRNGCAGNLECVFLKWNAFLRWTPIPYSILKNAVSYKKLVQDVKSNSDIIKRAQFFCLMPPTVVPVERSDMKFASVGGLLYSKGGSALIMYARSELESILHSCIDAACAQLACKHCRYSLVI
jgi:hypothetical protein